MSMMENRPRVAVTPPPICKSPSLRQALTDAFPDTRFNDAGRYLSEDELVAFSADAEALLIGRDPLTERVLDALPRLKIVAKYGVGLDNLDESALRQRGVRLGWTPGVNRRSVAELTLALILGLCHNVFSGGHALREGRWVKDGGGLLEGRTVGLVGCGHIGSEVARLLQPFACRLLVRDILDKTELCARVGAAQAGFDEVVMESDILTLHVPLTDRTRNLVDEKVLARMKPSAFLINTSRGGVVDEAALKRALQSGRLAGAALDVFAEEPPRDRDLLACPSLIATPHIGGNAVEAVEAMARSAIGHIVEFFNETGRAS